MGKKIKRIAANVVVISLIVGGVAWIASTFWHFGGEYTNNAQVEQDKVNVNSRVQGFINKVFVEEFQYVTKGDTLLTIEDSEFRLHLAQAESALANARAGKSATSKGVENAQNQITVTDAGIAEVEVLLRNAEADYQRYKALYEQESVTKQQFEVVQTQYEALKAKVETMRRQKAGTGIARDETVVHVEQQQANIEAAQAAVTLAKLNLSYCTVVAPCSGYTSRKLVQEGELAQPGMLLFSIVRNEDRWVTANFRETQRKGIAVGNLVEMKIDAFPDVIFEGKVSRISTATGAQYSPMAPDNSTGNFVKVEQRIPVRIDFTANNKPEQLKQLSAGMNVECTIKKKK